MAKPRRQPSEKEVDVKAIFAVRDPNITQFSFGNQMYPVKDGLVELPVRIAWVQSLIRNSIVELKS